MDSWNIKLMKKYTLIGRINSRIEWLVAKYGDLLDKAETQEDARAIEKECVYTLKSYGIDVVEGTI